MKMEGGRTDITILGDAVNTTARLSSEAAAGELMVSEKTVEMSGLSKDGHDSRKLVLKGKQETVDAWIVK
jgi:adenylate cyclase